MSRTTHKLTPTSRAYIADLIAKTPDGHFVEIRSATRTLDQNDRMWPMLDDIAAQMTWRDWQGLEFRPSADEWKQIFLASLKKQRLVPGLEGELVVLGGRSSTLTIPEMSDMMALIEAFAAQRGLRLRTEE